MTTRFIIAFVGRQGSSYLQGLLNSHPDAQCLGELLASPHLPGGMESYLTSAVHDAPKKATGFKLAQQHIDSYPQVVPFLKEHKYKSILLTRRNKLDQYISFLLASVNNSWRSDFGEYQTHSVYVDHSKFSEFVINSAALDGKMLERIQDLPIITQNYEELIENNGIEPIIDFLGLSRLELTSPFTRQRKKSQRESIVNYDELIEIFSGSDLIGYFTDRS